MFQVPFRFRRLFGALDLPQDGQLFRSTVLVKGWVLSRAGTDVDVDIRLDGQPVPSHVEWVPRPDVMALHGWSRRAHPAPGFRAEHSAASLVPGGHTLEAWAEAGVRRVHLGTRRFQVAARDVRLPRLLFIHIPKTAGTSLGTYLGQQYPGDTVWLHAENQVFAGAPFAKASLSGIDLLSVHLERETAERYFDTSGFAFLTVFRDPVRRLISHLVWMSSLQHPSRAAGVAAHPAYVREAVARLDRLGVSRFLDTLTGEEARLFDNCQTRYLLPQSTGAVDESHLDTALRRLAQFAYVGVTERLDDFLVLLASTYGWPAPESAPRVNAGVRRNIRMLDSMNAALRSRLEHLTRLDRVVYAEACARFERQFRDAVPGDRRRPTA